METQKPNKSAKPETQPTQTASDGKGLAGRPEVREDRYVVGLMFAGIRQDHVALIRKNKPTWQAGKLNGIGGKLEDGENIFDCMVREFKEETGWQTTAKQWDHYLTMSGGNDDGNLFRVDFFVTVGNLKELRSAESEQVEATPLNEIHPGRADMIENLPWLIGLALDYLQDGRPQFVTAQYPLPAQDSQQPACASSVPPQAKSGSGSLGTEIAEKAWNIEMHDGQAIIYRQDSTAVHALPITFGAARSIVIAHNASLSAVPAQKEGEVRDETLRTNTGSESKD